MDMLMALAVSIGVLIAVELAGLGPVGLEELLFEALELREDLGAAHGVEGAAEVHTPRNVRSAAKLRPSWRHDDGVLSISSWARRSQYCAAVRPSA